MKIAVAKGDGIGPEIMDAVEVRPLDPQDVHVRPGGEQRLLELHLLPGLQLHRPRLGIQGHDIRPGPQLDVVLLVPGNGIDVRVLPRSLPPHVFLGERRPFVRRFRLPPDQQDLAIGATLS